MKVIWHENIIVGTTERKIYFEKGHWSLLRRWNPAGVEPRITNYSLQVDAVYDKKTSILGVSCYPRSIMDGSNYYEPESIVGAETKVLETAPTREAAIRSVLAHIDRWTAAYLAELPASDTRTYEQVKADYFAAK